MATKPNETLLDLACGKGRHSVAFAAHGLDVTGVDLSRESIEYALQSETAFLHFYVHDMRQMFRKNDFDYVLMADGPLKGLLSRCVIVVDADGKVVYAEQVGEIATEPDYTAALASLG